MTNTTTKLNLALSNDSNERLDKNVEVQPQTKDEIQDTLDQMEESDSGIEDMTELKPEDEELVISIFELLSSPVVVPLLTTLVKYIRPKFTGEIRFPILARIKTCILFYFAGNGNLSQFCRALNLHQKDWGAKLGYNEISKEMYDIPSYKCIHEFLRCYLGDAIYDNFDEFVKIVMQFAEEYGLHPGWRSAMDSTPHESTPNDEDAEYNGHYEINGYKEHRLICVDTDIPFSFSITPANEYDGHYAEYLIDQGLAGGAKLAEIWADQHYITYDNLPYYELKKGLTVHYRINKDWKLDKSITQNEIHRMYQKLYKHDDFLVADNPNCSLEFQLEFIYDHTQTDRHRQAVGQFLRNRAHQKYVETPKQYLHEQGVRSIIEGGFGVEKSYSVLNLVKFRGIKSWKALISVRNFIDLIIAVFRMDLGEKTNLTSWTGIIV